MKRLLLLALIAIMATSQMSAQRKNSQWTLNTRAWSTNYFTTLIFAAVSEGIVYYAFSGHTSDSLWVERIIPTPDLVFPIGMGKSGFSEATDIYGPYHYAFGNPIKHIGDFGIGLDVSYKPCAVGIYAGAYFKSQELVWRENYDNLRGYYFQPRAGLMVGSDKNAFEAGVFYDVVTGCSGEMPTLEGKLTDDKRILKNGIGLDFAFSSADKGGRTELQFSMPLHNFFDSGFLPGYKRKVGYIMVTRRVIL